MAANNLLRPQKSSAPVVNVSLALVLLISVVLACSSGSGQPCKATLTVEGQTFTGEDASAEKATRNSCNNYCRSADPGYEAVYQAWLDSPAGRDAGRPSKEEAIFKDKKLMEYVTVFCANECLAKIKDGKAKVETKCK